MFNYTTGAVLKFKFSQKAKIDYSKYRINNLLN